MGKDGVVFVEALGEAEARVEDEFVARDACGGGGFEAIAKADEDKRQDLVSGER